MVSLSIKNVPDDLAERLRDRAKRNRRSLQGELLTILGEAVAPRGLTPEEVYESVKALGLTSTDESVWMIREDRDAR